MARCCRRRRRDSQLLEIIVGNIVWIDVVGMGVSVGMLLKRMGVERDGMGWMGHRHRHGHRGHGMTRMTGVEWRWHRHGRVHCAHRAAHGNVTAHMHLHHLLNRPWPCCLYWQRHLLLLLLLLLHRPVSKHVHISPAAAFILLFFCLQSPFITRSLAQSANLLQ